MTKMMEKRDIDPSLSMSVFYLPDICLPFYKPTLPNAVEFIRQKVKGYLSFEYLNRGNHGCEVKMFVLLFM